MNFQFREHWTVHFLEADCKTALWEGRYYDFETVDRVREILVRAEAPAETFAGLRAACFPRSASKVPTVILRKRHVQLA